MTKKNANKRGNNRNNNNFNDRNSGNRNEQNGCFTIVITLNETTIQIVAVMEMETMVIGVVEMETFIAIETDKGILAGNIMENIIVQISWRILETRIAKTITVSTNVADVTVIIETV